MYIDHFQSPIGWIEIAADESGISSVAFVEEPIRASGRGKLANIALCIERLERYFQGEAGEFDELPLSLPKCGSPFRNCVLQSVCAIPFGQTNAYRTIAERLHIPHGARAVGRAVGQNRHAILVPCHRVVGKNGALSGYAWGTWRKEWLLRHEQRFPANLPQCFAKRL